MIAQGVFTPEERSRLVERHILITALKDAHGALGQAVERAEVLGLDAEFVVQVETTARSVSACIRMAHRQIRELGPAYRPEDIGAQLGDQGES